uniref:Papilin n=1 Tax=Caenorhabditis japonica TaxID=281687 RepID=A0A8R1DF77_CAEJA
MKKWGILRGRETCERACGKWRSVAVCEQPKDHGDCQNAIPRWHYDTSSSQCKMFMWTGCGGNGNMFSAKADCENLCRAETSWYNTTDFCTLERSSGPCTDAISMWYFDSTDMECKPFTYGGCRGNQNRFVSKAQCQQSCRTGDDNQQQHTETICRLPVETGPCRLAMKKYFYDAVTQTCQMFHYGGCEGNANNFDSEYDCYNRCSAVKAEEGVERIGQLTAATTPVIYLVDKRPLTIGDTFRLRCNSYGVVPITWYKNGGLLQFGSRITEENDDTLEIVGALTSDAGVYTCIAGQESQMSGGVEVVIMRGSAVWTTVRPLLTPAPNFSLGTPPTLPPTTTTTSTTARPSTPSTTRSVLISNTAQPPRHAKSCVDVGNANTCNLVVKNGLCGKKRYGTFCCRTCTKSAPKA